MSIIDWVIMIFVIAYTAVGITAVLNYVKAAAKNPKTNTITFPKNSTVTQYSDGVILTEPPRGTGDNL